MTAAIVAQEPITLPEPIGLQPQWLDSPASRKVLRIGRRGGKTRVALVSAIAGHGPGEDGEKLHAGILGGGDVVWIAQDYPNLLRVAWKEEIRPRFGHLPYAKLNEQAHTLSLIGLGTLHFVSAESIDGIRGMGSKVIGVIVDEAAWLDLERSLLDVILPILLDNGGWLMLLSTTNAGPDGNSAKRLPSYFNLLCEQIRAGQRGPEWAEFTGTAFDNPVIEHSALNELIAEYPDESPRLRQEVYAELLQAGEGLVLPKLDAKIHLIEPFDIPREWDRFGAFDWGFNHPWCFAEYAASPDGVIYALNTIWGRQDQKEQIIEQIKASTDTTRLRAIWAGPDIWGDKGRAVGYTGPTIAETMLLAGLKVVEADNRRVAGLDNLRSYTAFAIDDDGHLVSPPRFQLFKTEGNRRAFVQMQQMQVDPKRPEDALKVDADYAGKGGDDGYDVHRYGLMSRPLIAETMRTKTPQKTPDRAITVNWKRGKPNEPPPPEQVMQQHLDETTGNPLVGRYSRPR